MKNEENINDMIDCAVNGDKKALEKIIIEIKDFVFNISLRMLGTVLDAEDASQDILIKIITNLSMFKKNSKFETWIYRIATNYLLDYKKSMFVQYPLDFNFYADDIKRHQSYDVNSSFDEKERKQLADELKLSCTNVMLQCLSPLNRCVFIMGTMFNLNSQWASEILELSPESYRKRLSRSRKKMQEFLFENCEYAGGVCKCNNRIEYAIQCFRLNPANLEYSKLESLNKDILNEYKEIMENIEDEVDVFKNLPLFYSNIDEKTFLNNLILSKDIKKILNFSKGKSYGEN